MTNWNKKHHYQESEEKGVCLCGALKTPFGNLHFETTTGISREATRGSLGAKSANNRPIVGSREEFIQRWKEGEFDFIDTDLDVSLGVGWDEVYDWHISEMEKMLTDIIEASTCDGMYSPDDIAEKVFQSLKNLKQK